MVSLKSTLVCLLFTLALAHKLPPAPATSPPSPTPITCPAGGSLVRSAGEPTRQSLSAGESAYISSRASKVLPNAWKTYFKNVLAVSPPTKLPDTLSKLLSPEASSHSMFPKLGIAVSGGGYRAALFGAAVLSSLDERNNTASKETGTGGLLQAATYLSGLSGGAWLVTSLAQANFPTIADLTFPPSSQANSNLGNAAYGGFLAQFDLTNPGGSDENVTIAYLETLLTEVAPKFAAGFPITVTDLWSRGLARHFVNGTTAQNVLEAGTHGAGILFSDIANVPSFVSHEQPFPIIVANSIPPNANPASILPGFSVPLTSEIWEFNVFEAGSFDPMLASFIPTALLGSFNSTHCFTGFSQAAYLAGVSSNIFNSVNTALAASPVAPLLELIEGAFGPQSIRLDSAAVPNPFKGINPHTFANTNEEFVTLVDGGSDGEEIPFQPLLVGARGIDTIVAIDASADTEENWANGTEIIDTAKRAALFGAVYPFPSIPSSPTIFVSQNLTRRPTFFGCHEEGVPLVIYIANGGPPANGEAPVTNTSTLQTTFTSDEVRAFIDQAFDIATQGIGGQGANWGTCLACGVTERARVRARLPRDAVCTDCLQRYCWNS
ncbi:lysophospholipase [Ramaria rubella]|nr:lysophospholipase [Ramaria rubella]